MSYVPNSNTRVLTLGATHAVGLSAVYMLLVQSHSLLCAPDMILKPLLTWWMAECTISQLCPLTLLAMRAVVCPMYGGQVSWVYSVNWSCHVETNNYSLVCQSRAKHFKFSMKLTDMFFGKKLLRKYMKVGLVQNTLPLCEIVFERLVLKRVLHWPL